MSTMTIDQAMQTAIAHHQAGQLAEAEVLYRQILVVQPHNPDALHLLGAIATHTGQHIAAVQLIARAVVLKPDYPEAHYNLGVALLRQYKWDEALVCNQNALALNPRLAQAETNLGNALKEQGRLEEALDAYRRAVALEPTEPIVHSNLLFALLLDASSEKRTLYNEHREWETRHGAPRRRFQTPHVNDPDPKRRLKIGYVSPDLRGHPVGRFLLPLLAHHDHDQFEITCYADVAKPDTITDSLREYADRWRVTVSLSEEQLAEQIRSDGIDILVDLSLHAGGNRLTVFARKPAPVQVTWLAYPGTSGLEAMDYRLSDPYLDPPGKNDDCYSEVSLRLPETYWCYPAPVEAPPVSAPPALSAAHITFGCLNNFIKVNACVLTLWARLLQAMPHSRLVLHTREGSHRERVRELMAAQGVSGVRVDFVGFTPQFEYYEQYQQIDIALDTFPYGGGTTTCDALWMGVPVVSLVGKTGVGRGGLSILSNIGLPELAAQDEDEYIKTAVELANDLPRLVELRATMRERMQASPLMDAPRFARNVEKAYRTMWKTWCGKQTNSQAKL